MELLELRKEIDAYHDALKEQNEYEDKYASLLKIADYTAHYLSDVYEEKGLYDYRKIEKMALRMPRMTGEDMEIARRYRHRGQTWRATIALNSVGLDFYIIQTEAEKIMAESGKYRRELAEHIPRKRLLIELTKRLKRALGHDKKSSAFSFEEILTEVKKNIGTEEREVESQDAEGQDTVVQVDNS
jgi:hypothetical protein